jgi:phenylalanyl-tRNA synthetase beta chain
VLVAQVLSVDKHPQADKLTVCKVDAGAGPVQVVCGAPNVRAGMKAPLAVPGARLPATEIHVANVRGIESAGMLFRRASSASPTITRDARAAGDAPVGKDVAHAAGSR